jgi:cation:H+ antiporter
MSGIIIALQFLAGFVFLVAGAEFLVRGASRLAARYHVPEVIIGLTIVAFGTSLPELVVSLTANMDPDGGSAIAIGNVVGSNIANLGLILGLAGLMAVLQVRASFPRREVPILLGVTILFAAIALLTGGISRIVGGFFVVGLAVFTFFNYRAAMAEQAYAENVADALSAAEAIDYQIARPSHQLWFDTLSILMGLGGLVLGANWLVDAAEQIALALGVPELIIGLTLVALGTSLPEVATTVVAVFRGNTDIAIGNVVGSNLFNILGIAGITALVSPIPLPPGMIFDFAAMIGLTALVLFFIWRKPHDINRWEAGTLLGCYLLYCALLVWRAV